MATLEDEIGELDELDTIRKNAYSFRQIGLEQLAKSFSSPISDMWHNEVDEPEDLIYPALIQLVSRRRFAQKVPKSAEVLGESAVDLLKDLGNEPEDIIVAKAILDYKVTFTNGRVVRNDTPIFQAARLFQGMLSRPFKKIPAGFFSCYYAIVRELATVDSPGWMMGSARARAGAIPTAFMTGECARALNALSRALEHTSVQFEILKSLALSFYDLRNSARIPKKWADTELRRLMISAYLNFVDSTKRSLVDIDLQVLRESIEQHDVSDNFLNQFFASVREDISVFSKSLRDAISQEELVIDLLHETFLKSFDHLPKEDKFVPANQANVNHQYALLAIRNSKKLLGKFDSLSTALGRFSAGTDPKAFCKVVEDTDSILKKEAYRVRKLLVPSRKFIESILDREVTNQGGERLNPTELVFSAAALATLDTRRYDSRFDVAVRVAEEWISNDGLLDSYSYLDTDERGYSLVLLGSEVLRCLSQLLEIVEVDVSPQTYRRIFSYFERVAVYEADGQSLVGWRHDRPRYPERAQRWTSALAILALDRFARMLDSRINKRVSRHFTCRKPSEIETPPLESLFYSDFGLSVCKDDVLFRGTPESKGESVAFTMERARAHIKSVGDVPGYNLPCYSILMFGPPGTGKTTLVEALAKSAKSLLIEVTPSDILLEGESNLERRARTVFRALSYLTQTVVLFDEFDPVLRSRSEGQSEEHLQNVYSFLTPGMLPKLKELNVQAKKKNSAFVLITNRVGTLDDAAIRNGRFDTKVGVYPPDLLSRAGILARNCDLVEQQLGSGIVQEPKIAFATIDTAGVGMTLVATPGNFVSLKSISARSEIPKKSIIQTVADPDTKVRFNAGPPDADPGRKYKGQGVLFASENAQWKWIIEQDEKAKTLVELSINPTLEIFETLFD